MRWFRTSARMPICSGDLAGEDGFLLRCFAAHPGHFELSIHSSDEFSGREGFCEVVVGSGFDTFNAGLFAGTSGKHNDGD